MVTANKILTVSYGTFSCTLEGFDDPFSTMQGIAEYFRDLAADDRYFGAEPPTPDAEMLHRIAEKEVQRRVTSRIEPNGIVLRQTEDEVAEQAAEPVAEAAPQPAPEPTPEPQPAPEEAAPAVEPVAEILTPTAPAQSRANETVAERLARIRAVVSQGHVEDAEEETVSTIHAAFEEPVAEDIPEPVEEPAEEPEAEEAENFFAEHTDDEAGTDAVLEDTPDTVEEPAEIEEEFAAEEMVAEPEAVAEAEEEAADIVEPVLESAEETEAEAEAPVEEPEQEEQDDAIAASGWDMPEEQPAEEELDPWAADAALDAITSGASQDAEDESDIVSGLAAALEESDEVVDDSAEFESEEEDAIDLEAILRTTSEAEEAADNGVAIEDADAVLAEADGEDAEVDLEPEVSDFAAMIAEEQAAAEREAEEADAEEEDGETENAARLLRMRRSDFEALANAMPVAEPAEEDDDLHSVLELGPALTADEVEEEAEEVAEALDEFTEAEEQEPEVVEEIAAEAEEDDVVAEEEAEIEMEAEAEPEASEEVEEVEEVEEEAEPAEVEPERTSRPSKMSVRHLLDVTNSEMAESEGSRRRSAIAHLKAAVAATRAERQARDAEAGPDAEEDLSEAYREDLAQAVRPRRPLSADRRSAPRRMPPLMLVSEQRVDVPEDNDAEPEQISGASIAPRRVKSEILEMDDDEDVGNIFSEEGSFAQFAEEMGATELPDLLEAAAAYYHFVEGQPHFSRPQVMNAVATMHGDAFNREDGLRSFGMLLRGGKIRKIRRGQFEVAESTRFRPQLQAGE